VFGFGGQEGDPFEAVAVSEGGGGIEVEVCAAPVGQSVPVWD